MSARTGHRIRHLPPTALQPLPQHFPTAVSGCIMYCTESDIPDPANSTEKIEGTVVALTIYPLFCFCFCVCGSICMLGFCGQPKQNAAYRGDPVEKSA